MKIWLDDVRPAPFGWRWCLTAQEVIGWMATRRVTQLHLDYDLGLGGCGEDVLVWVEQRVAMGVLRAPKIGLHTMNPVGLERMRVIVGKIQEYELRRLEAASAEDPALWITG